MICDNCRVDSKYYDTIKDLGGSVYNTCKDCIEHAEKHNKLDPYEGFEDQQYPHQRLV